MRRIDALADGAPPADTIPTGFPSVDRLLGGGLRSGDLVVLGGDIGSGKSAFALSVALNAAAGGHAVRFLSAEMTPDRLHERMLAMEGRARVDDLRRGALDDVTRAGAGAASLRLRNVATIVDRLPSDLGALTEAVRAVPGTRLVVINALQGLAESEAALRPLKALALDLGLVLLVSAHLPGFERHWPDPRPTLDDFGPHQAVKQHADIVLGLFREEMYGGGQAVEGATELSALKNRGGQTGYVDLYFYKQWMRFEDLL